MEDLPKSMIFVGGGYIGVELAQIMAGFGVETTLVVRSQVLKQIDRDIVDHLLKNMKHLGVTVLTESPHRKVTKNEDGSLTIHLDVKEGM